jgi:hypothetical protein
MGKTKDMKLVTPAANPLDCSFSGVQMKAHLKIRRPPPPAGHFRLLQNDVFNDHHPIGNRDGAVNTGVR